MKTKINFLLLLVLGSQILILSSCSVVLPRRQNVSNEISINNASQIEALRKEDYNVLRATTGSASTSKFYVLFFPIGKHKTNAELYESAYFDAVDNLPNADALILPRQKIKKFVLPLLLVNYSKREVTVSGVGISVKDKILENLDSDLPFQLAQNYCLKTSFRNKGFSSFKITTKNELDRMFEKSAVSHGEAESTGIDFSKQYVIAVVGKASKKGNTIYAGKLTLVGDEITLDYNLEEGASQTHKIQPSLLLVVDKKYQGNLKTRKL